MRAEENAREADSQGGVYSNFRDVWFDNTTPGLNGCSFNSFAGRGPINRLVLSPDYLARKPTPSVHPGRFSLLLFFRCIFFRARRSFIEVGCLRIFSLGL